MIMSTFSINKNFGNSGFIDSLNGNALILLDDGSIIISDSNLIGIKKLSSSGLEVSGIFKGIDSAPTFSDAIQVNGKYVFSANNLFFSSFNFDGTANTSFGSDGILNLDIRGTQEWDPILLSNNSSGFYVAVTVDGNSTSGKGRDICIVKINNAGVIDQTFAKNGVFTFDKYNLDDQVYSFIGLSDGSMLIGGASYGGNWSGQIIKLDSTGNLISVSYTHLTLPTSDLV